MTATLVKETSPPAQGAVERARRSRRRARTIAVLFAFPALLLLGALVVYPVLFSIGRSVGWMAHSIEQMVSGTLLRPRARYVGPATVSAAAPETSLSRPPRTGASSTGS